MKKVISHLLFTCALFALPAFAQGEATPPAETQKEYTIVPFAVNNSAETDIVGVRLNFPSGGCEQLTGLDLGLAGSANNIFGLQLNLLRNRAVDRMEGVQLGLINQAGNAFGVQAGLWNENLTANGFSVGLVNIADYHSGVQVGVINRCESIKGYQVGLINIIRASSVPFCPIVNFVFD